MRMAKFIGRRLLAMVFVLWAVATFTYFMVHVTPGDTATAILIETYGEEVVSPETLQAVREKFDLERPLVQQYADWLVNAVTGNFGISYRYNLPVGQMLAMRLPNTLELGIASLIIALVIAVPLGVLSALKHNRIPDHLVRLVVLLLASFPGFWLAIMGIMLFSIQLGWLPTSGKGGFESLILPACTLSVGMIASTTRMMRTSTLDVVRQDYMTVARVKGLTRGAVMRSHGIRNAIPPIITLVGLQIGHILGGAVVIESIFAWPGVGDLFINAVNSKDTPMIEGCVILIAFGYAFANLLVDIIYAWIDPRVKYSNAESGGAA